MKTDRWGELVGKALAVAVWLTVTAFSRPASMLARLAVPVARWQQRRVTQGYLRALRSA